MLSEKGQFFKSWLYQNVKAAPAAKTVAAARERLEQLAAPHIPEGVAIEAVRANGVNGEWVRAGQTVAGKVVVYCHGGGYIMGNAKTARGLAVILSQATNCSVFSLDYRLAPEHPFPAALDDARAAYRWLLETGNPAENIVFCGDSAGGGLALAALTALRDAGEKLPAGAVLITPWLDLAGTGDSRKTKQARDPWYNPESIELQAARFYAGANAVTNPLISPLYADLAGLPPILIQAAGDDTLVDDATRLYEKGKESGVDMTLEQWDEMWHVWHHFALQVPEAQEAVAKLGRFVQEKLGLLRRSQ